MRPIVTDSAGWSSDVDDANGQWQRMTDTVLIDLTRDLELAIEADDVENEALIEKQIRLHCEPLYGDYPSNPRLQMVECGLPFFVRSPAYLEGETIVYAFGEYRSQKCHKFDA